MANSVEFSPVQRLGLRHDLVGSVLKGVFNGQLRAGRRLVVAWLASEFGVSATPAREALLELNALGIVDMLPNRGAVVRPFGAQQLSDIYQVRRILETEATRLACGRLDRRALTSLHQEMKALAAPRAGAKWSQRAIAADLRLHEMIAENCGNVRLAEEIRRYGKFVQTAREVIDNHSLAQRVAVAEHEEILRALLAGDAKRAADAMSRHVQSALEVIRGNLFPSEAARA